jgi:hypothetical protein
MGQVIKMRGETAGVQGTVSPVRQPGGGGVAPAAQFVRLGIIAARVVDRAETFMNESAATGCRGCE